ncbi:hypothetical protein PVL29_011774 [Vitis rotundifolia]|uniref:PGG domain-containing protein n=1 Tax=Vitis rotundifolia TaxID=103349 RepID=A0AA38ZPD5_VITRO|nr:hypothetical protein PVL29_011774 [Vitis rotundifolia]
MATQLNPPEDASDNFYAYYRFNPSRDNPDSARNTLLVVGALIAAATFQAGINPPGGVWQDKTTVDGVTTHPGKAIFGSEKAAFTVFLFCNTLAFSSSLQMITYLIIGCPFSLEVLTGIYCMSGTYGASIAAVEPPGAVKSEYILLAFFLPYAVRMSQQIFKKYKKRG